MPKLLVSVRTVDEARIVIDENVEIVDVKEPDRGSLGRADSDVILNVAELAAGRSRMSVALGELSDFKPPDWHRSQFPCDYFKLGFAGSDGMDWRNESARMIGQLGIDPPSFIAVAYADWQRAKAPRPIEILKAAVRSRWRGVLIDTYEKDGSWLGEWLQPEEARQLSDQCHQNGLSFALAGSLTMRHIPSIVEQAPDIIGVRGAACQGGDRGGQIERSRVRQLIQLLQNKPKLVVESGPMPM